MAIIIITIIIIIIIVVIIIIVIIIVMQRWSSMTEASAFAAWLDHTRTSKHNRSKVQGSVMRLLHRNLCSAFAAWQEVAADRAQQKAKILSCLARIGNRVSLCLSLI